jgi:hypothetical protein
MNSKRNSVANKILWQTLFSIAERMRKIERTLVKAHNGYTSNECADMLATKGVNHETPFSNAQYSHPINEDTDTEVYKLNDWEESRVGNWKGDEKLHCTHAMKDGDNLQDYLSRDPGNHS